MGMRFQFEQHRLGFEKKNNFLGNGIRTPPPPLHDPLFNLREYSKLSQFCLHEMSDHKRTNFITLYMLEAFAQTLVRFALHESVSL